jgi:hypothetical protein
LDRIKNAVKSNKNSFPPQATGGEKLLQKIMRSAGTKESRAVIESKQGAVQLDVRSNNFLRMRRNNSYEADYSVARKTGCFPRPFSIKISFAPFMVKNRFCDRGAGRSMDLDIGLSVNGSADFGCVLGSDHGMHRDESGDSYIRASERLPLEGGKFFANPSGSGILKIRGHLQRCRLQRCGVPGHNHIPARTR